MAENRQVEVIGTRQGIPIYTKNPSIPPAGELRTKTHQTQIGKGKDAMIVSGSTGELLGKSMVAFMHSEDVDKTRFVKVFLEGVKRIAGLSKAGLSVFEIVYEQARANPNADNIQLSAYSGKQAGLSERTFYRGLRDLLEKEILYASPGATSFFMNIRYLFNGDRLHFITSYHLKESRKSSARELNLTEGDAL